MSLHDITVKSCCHPIIQGHWNHQILGG